ncbi:MAG: GAF domain-containing protein [Nitrospinae bacterium]|nr:GAF domain-containing protein [Nitrospinota bacterium]
MPEEKQKSASQNQPPQERVYSEDKNLDRLLVNVVSEVKDYADILISQIRRLSEIGIALSAERNLGKLLEMIVDEARRFTNADGGTLYIKEGNVLVFKILQNDTMKTRMGGTSGNPIPFPPVELKETNVSAYVALKEKSVNIPDVYFSDLFDFTGPRKFDQATGYRTKSMLVVPMKNHEGEIIGVLQFINAKEQKTGETIPFSPDYEILTESLASQAAVAITNVKLIQDIENLFESFVQSMATAIDARSPYNVSHTRRVAGLAVSLAEAINATGDGFFKGLLFSPEEMNELRIAGWLHDVGKVTTPEWVVNKATKLEKIIDRVELVKTRFHYIMKSVEAEAMKKKVEALNNGNPGNPGLIEEIDRKVKEDLDQLRDDLAFIVKSNSPGEFMEDEKINRLKSIAQKTYEAAGEAKPYLTDDELLNLSIRKGSITDDERKIMNDHVAVTAKMLEAIPFIKKLRNAPAYAAAHHECLNGKGYPKGLKGDQIPLQARILALVDFYEALTAQDRPYKKGMPLDKALQILGFAVKDGHLDKELYDLFIQQKVFEAFEKKFQAELV